MSYFQAKTWQPIRRATELLSLVSIAISLPVGLYQMREQHHKEIDMLVEKTYDDLDQRYIEFQKLALQYPRLDCYDKPIKIAYQLTPDEEVQQKLLYTIVLSILERAYLMYLPKEISTRQQQWEGWDRYADSFITRPAFREVWTEVGNEYDKRFQEYMNNKAAQFSK